MTLNAKISTYFDQKASSFDAIYSGRKRRVGRLWDKLTRQNIYNRFNFTLNAIAPISRKKILDVGCGSGRYCVEFAKLGAEKVIGVDLSLQMIELSKQLAENHNVTVQCHFLQQDIMDLHDLFDDTIAIGFFDYVQQPQLVLTHLRSLTKGKLVASFPAVLSPRVPFRKTWLALRGCPVYFYTKSEILLLCQNAGFVCHTLIREGPIYLLIAKPDFKVES